MVIFSAPPNTWQVMYFLNPLNALIPEIPFSLFAKFWVRATIGARESVSVGFWGSCQLTPFWGGGVRPEGSIDAHPPANGNLASPAVPALKTLWCRRHDL